MRKYNGFTLVEIIVSIAIGSIVLLIAGGIILSSSNFLMTTTDMDIDKRAVDSIVDFVRGEIEYSTDVRFVQHGDKLAPDYTKDSDWHYFYIKDNELYRDGAKVFAKSFTNNKSLSISMKGNGTSTSNHRLDIKYTLLDNKNEISYSSRDTVMLLNLSVSQEILNQGIYSADYKDLSDNGYWLFYTKKAKDLASIPEEDSNFTGTVADQFYISSVLDVRGEYRNTKYRLGDIVNYNGKWWMCNVDELQSVKPDQSASHWKCLSENWVQNSKYSEGDIVIYLGKYYQRKTNDTWNAVPPSDSQSNTQWKLIDKAEVTKKQYTIPKVFSNHESDKKTVIKKLLNHIGYDGDLNTAKNYSEFIKNYNEFLEKIPLYNPQASYSALGSGKTPSKAEEFVKIPMTVDNKTYYRVFYRVYNHGLDLLKKSNDGYFDWQEICMDFIYNSAYVKGDIIYAGQANETDLISWKCVQNVIDVDTITSMKIKASEHNGVANFNPNDPIDNYPTYEQRKEGYYHKFIYPNGSYASGAGNGVIWTTDL